MCRVCGKMVESVGHLASGCGGLAQREYKRRHNRMGLRVYWELCRRYGIKCAGKWFEEVPEEVRVSEDGAMRFGGIGVSTPHKKWNIIVQMLWLSTGSRKCGSLWISLCRGTGM